MSISTERANQIADVIKMDGLHNSASDILLLAAERDRLRAIVERLPKTADGVPVVPGEDEVFDPIRHKEVLVESQDSYYAEHYYVTSDRVAMYYSTREAAEAAMEGEG
jgi:hypothetical protein